MILIFSWNNNDKSNPPSKETAMGEKKLSDEEKANYIKNIHG